MRSFIDFHTHSTASDGTSSPEEVVRLADAEKLAAVALTDHDTTDGLAAARSAAEELPELRFISGIEISAQFPTGVLHILGLGVDERSAGLIEALSRLRAARDQRNPRILARLQQLGMDISMDDVLAVLRDLHGGHAGKVVSRLHIAEAMRRKGLVTTTNEAFELYIDNGGPAYVDKERLTPRQALEIIREAGGVAALAHPVYLGCRNSTQFEGVLRDLISVGLEGIEAYYPDHTADQTRLYLDLARRYDLVPVGGSDFHGAAKPQATVGRPRVPLSVVAASRFATRLLASG